MLPGALGPGAVPPSLPNPERVKDRLFFGLTLVVKRVLRSAHGQPQRHRAEIEVAPHRIYEITLIAGRQLVDPSPEDDEARWPRLHLGDVSELDPLASRRGRRVRLDRPFEPAVEL